MSFSRPTLKGSKNYIWWEKDELGKGATARVYKCREKKTGDVYAVKVYTPRYRNDRASIEHQEREFALLQKLKHENIVKMLAIEEESQADPANPTKVIVMEYCNGGSLYSILDEPKNAYGLGEEEFLLFLEHISDGLKYLREYNIVHRDIKPGNIMKLITPEGRSIYKLTDFGAARALDQQDESFHSMYGTEEYLHPDLYDRAVIRRGFGKKSFTASVDLWSVGATIYHVATGTLPFRPNGGRKNREGMHRILSDKRHGVISGVQDQSGNIKYDDQLPKTCQLSDGLKRLITPLIAGLLEVDVDKCFDFDQYFANVNEIVKSVILTVYDACHAQIIKVYAKPTCGLRDFQHLISKQTTYNVADQLLLYENSMFDDLVQGPDAKAERFPATSEENPIFLYNCIEHHNYADDFPIKYQLPKFKRFAQNYNLDTDYMLAKDCTGVMLYIARQVKQCLIIQDLIDRSVKCYENYLIRTVKTLKENIDLVFKTAEAVRGRFTFMKDLCMLPSFKPSNPNMLQRLPQLQLRHDELGVMMKDLKRYGADYKEKLADKKELSAKWKNSTGCGRDMCCRKVASLAESVESCRKEFENDKNQKQLPYNEEQIHKFEKNKMSANCTEAMSLIDDHCWNNTRKMYHYFLQSTKSSMPTSWFQMAYKIRTKCMKLEQKMMRLRQQADQLTLELSNLEFDLRSKLDQSLSKGATTHVPFMIATPDLASSGFGTMSDTESLVTSCFEEMSLLEKAIDESSFGLDSIIQRLEQPDAR